MTILSWVSMEMKYCHVYAGISLINSISKREGTNYDRQKNEKIMNLGRGWMGMVEEIKNIVCTLSSSHLVFFILFSVRMKKAHTNSNLKLWKVAFSTHSPLSSPFLD